MRKTGKYGWNYFSGNKYGKYVINPWLYGEFLDWWSTASEMFRRLKVYLRIIDRPADDLAAYFESIGVRGKRGDCEECPVAVWLRRTPSFRDVRVQIYEGEPIARVNQRYVNLPTKVGSFLRRFDAGGYPNLDLDNFAAEVPA